VRSLGLLGLGEVGSQAFLDDLALALAGDHGISGQLLLQLVVEPHGDSHGVLPVLQFRNTTLYRAATSSVKALCRLCASLLFRCGALRTQQLEYEAERKSSRLQPADLARLVFLIFRARAEFALPQRKRGVVVVLIEI